MQHSLNSLARTAMLFSAALMLGLLARSAPGETVLTPLASGDPVGACCLPDLTCDDNLTQFECEFIGGSFQGEFTTCASVTCGPLEACCLLDGSCSLETVSRCASLGGTSQGPDSTCATANCPVMAACCFSDGFCADLEVGECTAQAGTPQAPGSTCAASMCPVLEACCLTDSTCIDVTVVDCVAQGGMPRGPGTECATTSCPGAPSACCFSDQTCLLALEADCEAMGGSFVGDGINCADIFQCGAFEACCRPDGTCTDETGSRCAELGGTSQGAFTICSSVGGSCDQPEACCLPTGVCLDLFVDDCIAQGGSNQGAGTDCASTSCGVPPCGFLNPSFESGDFTDWITQDLTSPFQALRVDPGGFVPPGFGFLWVTAATDGMFTAYHGFDGDGASSGVPISLAQDVTINAAGLSFDWRAAWDMVTQTTPSAFDRTFDVVIRPVGGGSELARFNVLTAPASTVNLDTGQMSSSIDLSAFLGQSVRVSFEWNVPEDFSGPAHFQFDNVCLFPLNPCDFVNPSFESGDFSGWITQDLSVPFFPLVVSPGGDNTQGWPWSTAPTKGVFTAVHGFDGNGATSGVPIVLAQDLLVLEPGLSFNWRAAWNIFGTLDRSFDVVIQPAGGGAPLASFNVLTATAGTQVNDTGQRTSVIDLSAYLNTVVRISFEWTVPEDFSGPAMFQFDNVCIAPFCIEDFTGPGGVPDGFVGIDEFLAVLAQWGCTGSCSADVAGPGGTPPDGVVGIDDFLKVLADWGACP